MKNNKLKIFIFCLGLLLFSFSFLSFTRADSPPQFLVSWKAYSYTPDWYQGKSFPIYSTPIDIAFELIDNDYFANISKNEIRWYINDKLFTKGNGLKNIRFVSKNQADTNISVRIAIVKYKGEELNKFIYIPSKKPEAVINAPYLTKQVKTGNSYNFKIFPFFFNISSLNDLSFEWLVNSQAALSEEYEANVLNLNISTSTPNGLELNINTNVSNILQSVETAGNNLKLIVQ